MLERNGLPSLNVQWLERTLRARWGGLPGVHAIAMRMHGQIPVIVVSGSTPNAPRGITDIVRVDIGGPRPIPVQVFWERVAAASPRQLPFAQVKGPNPANEAMWAGHSEVRPRGWRMIDPTRGMATGFPSATQVPGARLYEYQFFLPARTPELPFFSRPFNLRECRCLNELTRSQTVIRFNVGADEQLTLTGISYNAVDIPVANQVRFSVRDSSSLVASWDDIVASNSDGPAHQFALCGHDQPMPLNVIIDHDRTLTVEAEFLGIYPFATTPPYATTAQICILMQGHVTKLNDTRSGSPRPFDLGDLNDVAQGNMDIVGDFKDLAAVEALEAVLAQAEAEIEDPADPQQGVG